MEVLVTNAARRARSGVQKVEQSWPLQRLGRFGDACYGIVHLLVAWIALQIALGGTASAADPKGAMATIAAQPLGTVLLVLLAVGLSVFGFWQLLAAVVSYRWVEDTGARTRRRLGAAGRGIAVLVIASFTVQLLVSGHQESSDTQQQAITARLLTLPAGRFLVAGAGVAVLVVAAMTALDGTRRQFMEDLDTSRLSTMARRWTERLGVIGCLAKGTAFAVLGGLLLVAAIRLDPTQSGGLDKALRTLASQPFGPLLLAVVALGFAAFGVYLFADAHARRT